MPHAASLIEDICRPKPRRQAAPPAAAVSLLSRPRSSCSSPDWPRSIPPRTPSWSTANPFSLLVAVVLSAQATDVGVNKATKALFAAAPTPAAMVALGEERVREHIKTIGLFRNKARNVLALSRAAAGAARRRGAAATRAALEALPGRRPQDRQRRAQRGVRRADDRGRHPCLPRRQSHRPGARARRPRRSRPALERGGARPVQARRPSLADPAWPLRLPRPPARTARPASCAIICRYPDKTPPGRPAAERGSAQSGS